MNFQYQEALYFILPLTFVVLALGLYARARRRRAAAAFIDAEMAPRILPRENAGRFWAKLFFWEAALVFSLLALARPQWGDIIEEVKVKGTDLYVLIDVSRSMLAKDVPPNRLERAKLDVSSLLNRLKGERVGLIAFAGRAAVKCPLTADYAYFRVALTELGPHSVERGGTAIGDAIRTALNVLPAAPDRDQALLLITDGDDQESEPLLAAAMAAERHVAIFTVGLGNPNEGSGVPDKDDKIMQYDGKNVVSKMDDELLRKIALQTSGVYVPARTSAYDLGKLYEETLSRMRGEYAKEQRLKRMAERFEIPLLLALLCFLLEAWIRPYDSAVPNETETNGGGLRMNKKKTAAVPAALFALAVLAMSAQQAGAADVHALADEGMALYGKKDYAAAGEKFSAAELAAPKDSAELAARAAFDAGCAYQRKGDAEKAREAYMKATLAHDKTIAASAQFNLGDMASDAAKELAGAQPELVPPEKRAEILEKLKTAVGYYRSCLDLQPEHAGGRKNLELIRQWIKLYTNKWAEQDRKKRREEMNLPEYLDWLAQTQRALRQATRALRENASSDECFDLKRAQDELEDEIGPLKEKIEKDIRGAPGHGGPSTSPNAALDAKQKEAGIKKLQEWADETGAKMRAASGKLNASLPDEALIPQKEALTPLNRSWDALAPFSLVLNRDYDEESKIVEALKPPENDGQKDMPKDGDKAEIKPAPAPKPPAGDAEALKLENEDLAELQTDVSRRTLLLLYKAEQEIEQIDKNAQNPLSPKPEEKKKEKEWLTREDVEREEALKKNPRATEQSGKKDGDDKEKKDEDKPPTPEEIKAGLKKAIELAPKAVEKMDSATEHLRKQERAAALPETEEAKRILKEILDAQPKQKNKDKDKDKDQKQDQKKDQQNKDQKDKQDQDKNKDKDKKDQQKKDDEKKKEEQDKQKQDEKKDKDQKDKDKQEQQKAGGQKQPLSKEEAEAVLRKVRERELDRRKQKADEKEAIFGRMRGVEKDW